MANKTKTTTSDTTVIPKNPRVNGPFALNSFAMAMALAGERAVMIDPTSMAIPVLQPEDKSRPCVKDATPASMSKRTPPVTKVKVRIEMAATDKKIVLNKSRNSGR
jgi:hypothetical protein